ncbi:hypothetical protein [Alkaliphilus crotonatoxidans]
MNTLQSIIRLFEIKETLEAGPLSPNLRPRVHSEFKTIKAALLDSNFAFDNVKELISEIEYIIEEK